MGCLSFDEVLALVRSGEEVLIFGGYLMENSLRSVFDQPHQERQIVGIIDRAQDAADIDEK